MTDFVSLEIQDFGRGMPQAVMERFQRTGTGSGVGLAGIRERVKELGGDFNICSNGSGTTLISTVPLPRGTDSVNPKHEAAASERQRNQVTAGLNGIF